MRQISGLILTFVLAIELCACGQNAVGAWQEQYDLGVRYISEGNYEEAIIAFTAAIEIDPKRPEAYEKAAEVYVKLGDLDAATEILEQGYAATGDLGLEEQLSRLKEEMDLRGQRREEAYQPEETIEVDGQGEDGIYQPVGADAVSGTLSLSDMESSYKVEDPVVEYNEGAIGIMDLRFIVNGPSGIREVNIWTWSQEEIQDEEIPRLIAEAVAMWKSDGMQISAESEIPFEWSSGFPVWEEDRNTTVYVLLVGLDADGNAVGHAVVTVTIP